MTVECFCDNADCETCGGLFAGMQVIEACPDCERERSFCGMCGCYACDCASCACEGEP